MNNQPKFRWSTPKVVALCVVVACLSIYGVSKAQYFSGSKAQPSQNTSEPVSTLDLSAGLQQEEPAEEFKFIRVTEVFEGDVFRLADGSEVNLIGVSCPKSDETDSARLAIAREALAFTTGAVLDREVRLEYEPEHLTDNSGRTLAYVYLRDGSLLNGELIKRGYGNAVARNNYRFANDFRKHELAARNSKIGLWEDREPIETIAENDDSDSTGVDSSIATDSASSQNLNAVTRPRSTETIPQSVEPRSDEYRSTYQPAQNYPPSSQTSNPPPSFIPRTESRVTPRAAENGSYYGQISERTGRPKTVHVEGYTRRDGTYVRGHYRSKSRR